MSSVFDFELVTVEAATKRTYQTICAELHDLDVLPIVNDVILKSASKGNWCCFIHISQLPKLKAESSELLLTILESGGYEVEANEFGFSVCWYKNGETYEKTN